jgi:hypothetical protein
MRSFKDSEGLDWKIALNGWQLKKLKEQLDFDARDPESILKASADPCLLVNVLYVLCESQATERGISDQQFGESMDADAIENATEAYLQETTDFFPLRQRQAMKTMLAKMSDYQEKAARMAQEKLRSQQLDNLMESAIAEASQNLDRLLSVGTTTGEPSGK